MPGWRNYACKPQHNSGIIQLYCCKPAIWEALKSCLPLFYRYSFRHGWIFSLCFSLLHRNLQSYSLFIQEFPRPLYPVVQGEDNSYYLKHLFDGTYNANGCLFLDSRVKNDFSEAYSIIYGHHMKNGTMFSSLDGYKRQEYYEAHPNLLLITPEQTYLLNLFSGYVASVEDHAWDISFQNELEFEEWLISATENSCFESHVCPSSTDRILTLSTCSYEFDNARFVILGILEPITKDWIAVQKILKYAWKKYILNL